MKRIGIQVFIKLNVMLAVLLCGVLAFAAPVTAHATPFTDTAQQDFVEITIESPLVLFAGETSSGESQAVLQLDKSLLTPILQLLLQRLYPQVTSTAPAPHSYPASKGDCGLHTILTKGP